MRPKSRPVLAGTVRYGLNNEMKNRILSAIINCFRLRSVYGRLLYLYLIAWPRLWTEIWFSARKNPQTALGSAIFIFALCHTWDPFHRLVITATASKGNETTDSSKPARAVKPHLQAQK